MHDVNRRKRRFPRRTSAAARSGRPRSPGTEYWQEVPIPRACSILCFLFALGIATPHPDAQTLASDDPVLKRIWDEAMHQSQIEDLGQAFMDSIGPRLTGAPGIDRGHDKLVHRYGQWGIQAENRQYGTAFATAPRSSGA